MEKMKVAVIGATGAVGQVFMSMLAHHEWFELAYITASSSRVGERYGHSVHWVLPFEMAENLKHIEIREYDPQGMKDAGVQIVFSAMPANVAAIAEPELRDAGFYVFSNAGAMRYESNVPILIPECNLESLHMIREQGYPESGFIVTNANCTTTGLALALAPLAGFGIRELVVSTYQSVSGAGYPGLSSFDITDNVIPYIGGEEEKVEIEIKKILTINPEVYVYCARVPVMFGHNESVWIEFEQDVTTEDVIAAWNDFRISEAGLPSSPARPVIYDSDNTFPQPKYAFWGTPNGMVTFVGRLKKKNHRIGFNLMVNNVVKGAAGGSIQNAEAFVQMYNHR